MTNKRLKLIDNSDVIVRGANVRLLAPENIEKGDDFDCYSDDYLKELLDQEIREIYDKVAELRQCPRDDTARYAVLGAELVLECGDALNDMRFICQKYGALRSRPKSQPGSLRLDE